MAALDISSARKAFRALGIGYLFADNAGGSQCLTDVVSRISDYLLYSNVQLGADYLVSVNSTNRVASGAEAARELFNAESVDEVAYGSSSTMLVENLARAMQVDVQAGEEIIITGEHECEYPRESRNMQSSHMSNTDTVPAHLFGRLASSHFALSECWSMEASCSTQGCRDQAVARHPVT